VLTQGLRGSRRLESSHKKELPEGDAGKVDLEEKSTAKKGNRGKGGLRKGIVRYCRRKKKAARTLSARRGDFSIAGWPQESKKKRLLSVFNLQRSVTVRKRKGTGKGKPDLTTCRRPKNRREKSRGRLSLLPVIT